MAYRTAKLMLEGKDIPMKALGFDPVLLLLFIRMIEEYGENGKKTGKILGYTYECVDTTNFDRFRIKIKGQTMPLMSNEDLQELREKGDKVAVEFVEPTVRLYWSSLSNGYEESFSAKDVLLVTADL